MSPTLVFFFAIADIAGSLREGEEWKGKVAVMHHHLFSAVAQMYSNLAFLSSGTSGSTMTILTVTEGIDIGRVSSSSELTLAFSRCLSAATRPSFSRSFFQAIQHYRGGVIGCSAPLVLSGGDGVGGGGAGGARLGIVPAL